MKTSPTSGHVGARPLLPSGSLLGGPRGGGSRAGGRGVWDTSTMGAPAADSHVIDGDVKFGTPATNYQFDARYLDDYARVGPLDSSLGFQSLEIRTEEDRTRQLQLGVGVSTDAGLTGNFSYTERNADIFRWPRSWRDITDLRAFAGAGQTVSLRAQPGTEYQSYSASFSDDYFMHTWISFSLAGSYYTRYYSEWHEQRLGGTTSFGYLFRNYLRGAITMRAESVQLTDLIVRGVPDYEKAYGDNGLYAIGATIRYDSRDNRFVPTEGSNLEISFEQVFGTFMYPRATVSFSKMFPLHQRLDGSGRHILAFEGSAKWSGKETPVYERFFAGGASSIRGFEYRNISPKYNGIDWLPIGGNFMLLGSANYFIPIDGGDKIRLVGFCDAGTVQSDISNWDEEFRVSAGFGLRLSIPAMGPMPIALDFAFPIVKADSDKERMFNFRVGMLKY